MKRSTGRLILLFIINSLIIINYSCRKDDFPPLSGADLTRAINNYVYGIMKNWYLWYDKLRTDTPDIYLKPQKFLDSLKYKLFDRWSFIITTKEYDDYFIHGKMYGHGFLFGLDAENKFRIAQVFKNSNLFKVGVHRGWIIEKINGIVPDTSNVIKLLGPSDEPIQNIFLFKKPDGSEVTYTFTKKELTMNMVIYRDTFHVDSKIVGYIVFEGFIADARAELNDAFSFFKNANINELVLDLRYNGGGDLNITSYLAGLIGGNTANGQPFINLIYNDKKTLKNSTYKFPQNDLSVNITRLFAITSSLTASASEAVLNGLEPYMNVYLVGSPTYGKPVGMQGFEIRNLNYILFPIAYNITNKNNIGDYFNGIPVNKQSFDDIYHDFGDRNEACLQQALYFIQYGDFATSTKAYYAPYRHRRQGWKEIIAY